MALFFFFSDFVDGRTDDDWLPLSYQYYGSPAYPHACSSYGASVPGFGVLAGYSELLKKKLFDLLKVGADGLLGYNLLEAIFTIGTYIWDGIVSTERSCLNFRGPIIIMTVALTVNIPMYK